MFSTLLRRFPLCFFFLFSCLFGHVSMFALAADVAHAVWVVPKLNVLLVQGRVSIISLSVLAKVAD
jgi:hypothetical protein